MSEIKKFEELNLSKEVLKAVSDMGFNKTSPIQAQAIPLILQGLDVTGLAMTGTGKTAAYGLPIINNIDSQNRKIQSLIICPTRELAIQIAKELNKFSKYRNGISILAIYGGQPIDMQLKVLNRGAQVIVGTPGRLLDHLNRGSITLDTVKVIILDEADEMMNMGFRQDIETILKNSPKNRQTITFSATMPKDILDLIGKYQKNPQIIKIGQEASAAATVEQRYFYIQSDQKFDLLIKLLKQYNPYSALIFCNTKRKVDNLTKKLRYHGNDVDALHGDVSQPKRNKIMDRFRAGKIQILVATDVAARGIDVPSLDIIFNYEIPNDERLFVHRIGRTGRAGKTGVALSLVSERENYAFQQIKKVTKSKFIQDFISFDDLNTDQKQVVYKNNQKNDISTEESRNDLIQYKIALELKHVLQNGAHKRHIKTVETLINEKNSPISVAAALIELLLQK